MPNITRVYFYPVAKPMPTQEPVAPKKPKPKTQSFPWHQYPELETSAFRMIFIEGCSMREVKEMLYRSAPEAAGNTTFVNQRFVRGKPSDRFNIKVKEKTDDSETSWPELWRIGTVQQADGWIRRVVRHARCWNRFQNKNGGVPINWQQIDPNGLISPAGRKALRHMFWKHFA